MSECRYCNKKFYDPKRPNGTHCNSCRVSKRRWKTKIELVNKLGGKCQRCGYSEHPAALQFHHKNPSNKKFQINSNKLLLKDVDKEVNKCILLCANCHSIEHTNKELLEKFEIL